MKGRLSRREMLRRAAVAGVIGAVPPQVFAQRAAGRNVIALEAGTRLARAEPALEH